MIATRPSAILKTLLASVLASPAQTHPRQEHPFKHEDVLKRYPIMVVPAPDGQFPILKFDPDPTIRYEILYVTEPRIADAATR